MYAIDAAQHSGGQLPIEDVVVVLTVYSVLRAWGGRRPSKKEVEAMVTERLSQEHLEAS